MQPNTTARPPLTFASPIACAYWRTEVALGCTVALAQLRRIVEERGADYAATVRGLER
jgi:hypothetical protein